MLVDGRRLEFIGIFFKNLTSHSNSVTPTFPTLEDLTQHYPDWNFRGDPFFSPFGPIFASCSHLHTFRTGGLQDINTLDLTNLTFLEVYHCIGHLFTSLLRQCPLFDTPSSDFDDDNALQVGESKDMYHFSECSLQEIWVYARKASGC